MSFDKILETPAAVPDAADTLGTRSAVFEVRFGDLMMMSTVDGTVSHAVPPPTAFKRGSLTFDLGEADYDKDAAQWKKTMETMLPVSQDDYYSGRLQGHDFHFEEDNLHYMANVGQVANNYIHNMQKLAGKHDEKVVRAQGLLVPFPCGFTIPICCPLALICPICPTIVVGLPALFCCIV